jgi:hypothetical protein
MGLPCSSVASMAPGAALSGDRLPLALDGLLVFLKLLLGALLLGQGGFLGLAGGLDELLGVVDVAEAVLGGELLQGLAGSGAFALGLLLGGDPVQVFLGEGVGRRGRGAGLGRGGGGRRCALPAVVVEDAQGSRPGVGVGPAAGGGESGVVLRGATHLGQSSQGQFFRPRA